MATVIKSIGTFTPGPVSDSGRHYSTIALWEADLDVTTIYASGDDAVGELYNDSNFNESFTLNGGATVGLVNKILRPAVGHGHTGIAGTGVRIVCSAARNWVVGTTAARVEGIEFHLNGFAAAIQAQLAIGTGPTAALPALLHRLIVHDGVATANTTSNRYLAQIDTGLGTIQNSILYNWTVNNTSSGAAIGLVLANSSANQRATNCTIHKITRNTGTGTNRGVSTGANNTCRNVIATGIGGTTSGGSVSFQHSATGTGETHNLSDDAGSANATNSVVNAVLADIYVSTVGGAEDLRLKAGSPAINVGVDLGAGLDGQFDITGYDRDATGVVWDIGAHEYVAVAGSSDAIITARMPRFRVAGQGVLGVPGYDATINATLPRFRLATTGTLTAPVFAGIVNATMPRVRLVATGATAAPAATQGVIAARVPRFQVALSDSLPTVLLLLEDGSGVLLHENGDRMLVEDGLTPFHELDAEPFLVRLTAADIGVLVGRAVAAQPFALTLGFDPVVLNRGYVLAAGTFGLTLTLADIGRGVGRGVVAEPFSVVLSWSESDLRVGRTVVAGPFTVTTNWAAAGLSRGYIFSLDGFALTLGWAQSGLLRGAWLGGAPFDLQVQFDEALLERRRSEIGWDTALLPPVCGRDDQLSPLIHAENAAEGFLVSEALQPVVSGSPQTLSAALHPVPSDRQLTSEALQPAVHGERKPLSDELHPRGTTAVPLPLESCK